MKKCIVLTRVTRVTRERQRGARGEFIAERPHQPATNILRRRKRFIFSYCLSFSGESHFFWYSVILIIFRVWGFAGFPSAMKRLRMISL